MSNNNNEPLKDELVSNSDPLSDTTQGISNNLDAIKQKEAAQAQAEQAASKQAAEAEQDASNKGIFATVVKSITDVEADVLAAEAKVATAGFAATFSAALETATDLLHDKGPGLTKFGKEVLQTKSALEVVAANVNADTTSQILAIDEKSKDDQIKIIMDTKKLTPTQAKSEFEKIERERERERRIAVIDTLDLAKVKATSGQAGGSIKRLTLGQIQKGGRQSAKRTKKSINDFLNSSVTSSHILKMVTKQGDKHSDNKRKTKVKVKRRNGKNSKKVRKSR